MVHRDILINQKVYKQVSGSYISSGELFCTNFLRHPGCALQVKVHPASLNSTLSPPERDRLGAQPCQVLIFDEKTRSESTLYVMQTTLIPPHLLLLVANRLLPPQRPRSMSDEEDSEDEEDWCVCCSIHLWQHREPCHEAFMVY